MKLSNKQLDKIKDITFRHDLHYELWDWLAKHPAKNKDDYFNIHCIHEIPEAGCYACDYVTKVKDGLDPDVKTLFCSFCPLIHNTHSLCLNGLYNKYINSHGPGSYDNAKRREYAMLIRDMKLNPMYNFKDSV